MDCYCLVQECGRRVMMRKTAHAGHKMSVTEVWLKRIPPASTGNLQNRKLNKLVNEDMRGRESSTSRLRK